MVEIKNMLTDIWSLWKSLPAKIRQYITLGIINTLTVYFVYSPYVFLWVGFTVPQYIRWLEGGIAYSLLTGWFFALVITRARRRLYPTVEELNKSKQVEKKVWKIAGFEIRRVKK